MTNKQNIKPFDITKGEKIEVGYHTALEAIFNHFINDLEVLFYDQYNKAFDFSYSIKTENKFSNFLKNAQFNIPIFIFKLNPLSRNCLLVLDNTFSNNIINGFKKTIDHDSSFKINGKNYQNVKELIDNLLSSFCQSWKRIYPVDYTLTKLVSNRIKAKILSPTEACTRIKVNIGIGDFQTHFEFCFSSYQLDPILKKFSKKALLAGEGDNFLTQESNLFLNDLLQDEIDYKIKGVIGNLNISHNNLIDSLKTGKVLKLSNSLNKNAIVQVNNKAVLSADIGVCRDNFSLQVNGKFEAVKEEIKHKNKPFSKINFPFQKLF